MPRPNPVVTTATLERFIGGRIWDAVLPNGCPFIAHIPTWRLEECASFQPGDVVRVEMTTYDFGIGRITGKAGGNPPAADGPENRQ